jgi:hypothetical protein
MACGHVVHLQGAIALPSRTAANSRHTSIEWTDGRGQHCTLPQFTSFQKAVWGIPYAMRQHASQTDKLTLPASSQRLLESGQHSH